VPLEDAYGARAELQINEGDDTGDAPSRSIFARRAHCRHATEKLGFTERLELLRPVGAVHLGGLFVTGRVDVVTAADIDEKLREQIAVSGAVPQMMGGSMIGRAGSIISS
jgi:hypothetical protein